MEDTVEDASSNNCSDPGWSDARNRAFLGFDLRHRELQSLLFRSCKAFPPDLQFLEFWPM